MLADNIANVINVQNKYQDDNNLCQFSYPIKNVDCSNEKVRFHFMFNSKQTGQLSNLCISSILDDK